MVELPVYDGYLLYRGLVSYPHFDILNDYISVPTMTPEQLAEFTYKGL